MGRLLVILAFLICGLEARSDAANAQSSPGRPIPAVSQVQAKSQVREEPPISDETLKALGSGFVIALASSTIILFILGCGSRVVVFADPSDALMTACVFIAPVVTAFALLFIGWATDFDNAPRYASTWEFAKGRPVMAFTIMVGLLWWTWAVIGTVVSSIRYNGLVIGLLVAVMKLGAVFTMLLAWFASEHAKTPNYSGVGPYVIFLGILAWFASRYVNGHRVMERREMLMLAREDALAQV